MKVITADRTFQGVNGRDEFQREPVADKVIELLTSDIHLSPMVIDGDWGTGKTEFCRKLIGKFEVTHDHYRLLYVDAFHADHADNPLMTILSAVMTLLPDGSKKTLLQKALPVVRYSLATVGKAVVSHVLKQNADDLAEGLDKSLQDAADKAIDASVKALLKDHEKAQENLKALQDALADIAADRPIVIFIDELDRCRPDFAVQMLEVIKHTFNVDGVQFVLVTNTRQLKAAINHRYGQQVDAQRYLDKFLKFSFCLPEFLPGSTRRGDELVLAATRHFSNLVRESAVLADTDLFEKHRGVSEFTESLLELKNASLREVETFVRHLEIYHRLSQGLTSNTIFGYQLLRIFGVFTFCFFPEIADSIQKNKTDANQVAALLGLRRVSDSRLDEYRISHTSTVAGFLTQASTANNESYLITELEAQKLWTDIKRRYFSNGWTRGASDDMFGPVKEAIFCLRLGSA